MRIGTWNMDGGWSPAHQAVIKQLDCDLLLLTEPHVALEVTGHRMHSTSRKMGPEKHWAAILTTGVLEPVDDPHPASAAALVNGTFVCASVLPWPLARGNWPWGPSEHQLRMEQSLDHLVAAMTNKVVIWGGDWNQPLTGNLTGFSRAAQVSILTALERLTLQVPTASKPSRRESQCSIDHVAVPQSWATRAAGHVAVDRSLSDHDAYWVEAHPYESTRRW
jgi:hypothetical protein